MQQNNKEHLLKQIEIKNRKRNIKMTDEEYKINRDLIKAVKDL